MTDARLPKDTSGCPSPRDADMRARRLYDQACRLANMGAWECDLATERLTWTDGVYQIFDLSAGTPLRRATIVDLYCDESRDEMEFLRAEVIRSGRSLAMDAQIRTAHGARRWMRLSVGVTQDEGRPVRLFGAKQDVTAERDAWERLRREAERDPLTGLANRGLFEAHYRAIVADPLNHASVSAIALIDVDRFKAINDAFGHLAGDACLRRVAMRLQRVFGDAMLVARIGGDEFAVLLRAPLGPARIRHMLERARDALARPIVWNAQTLEAGASIGATILGRPHVRRLSELFSEADTALYAAKHAGRGTVHVFGDESFAPPLRQVAARAG